MESRKENVSSKGTSLTSSFLYKCLTLALTLFVVLGTPIRNVRADTYDYDFENFDIPIWQWNAYRYFMVNGYELDNYTTITLTSEEILDLSGLNLELSDNAWFEIKVPSYYIRGASTLTQQNSPDVFCAYHGNDLNQGTWDNQGFMYSCRLSSDPYTEHVNNFNNMDFSFTLDEGSAVKLQSTLNTRFYTRLNFGEMSSGTYTGFTAYDSNKASTFSKGVTDLIFMIRPNVISLANANVSIYPQANVSPNYSVTVSNLGYYSGLTMFRIRVDTDSTFTGNLSIGRLVGRSETIYPVYFGQSSNMPDEVYTWVYGNRYVPLLQQIDTHVTDIYNYLEGGSSAQSSADSVVSSASSTDTATNQLHSFEETQITQFNTSLQSVPTSSSLLTTDGFLNGASYVRDMFDTVAVGQFRGLLSFTLIIGFALLMIGKVR